VRINGTYGFEPQLTDRSGKTDKSSKSDPGGKARSSSVPPTPTAPKSLVDMVMQTEEIDYKAVEQARQLLESGELDSQEAAERAAKAIIDLQL
jgi:hypothetical protein